MLLLYFLSGWIFISCFDTVYIYKKKKKTKLEFFKKLNEKGYKEVDNNFNLFSLVHYKVVDAVEYNVRDVSSLFPIFNLYTFSKIIRKQFDKEFKMVLNSLDNEEVLNNLEENNYIYRKGTISKKINHIENKISEINENNILFDKNDSLETLTKKRELLDEMIYLRNLQELLKNNASQESEEEEEITESVKPLGLVRKLFKVDKSKKTE